MQKTVKEMTATWLRDGRLSKGFTQKELAEKSNISMRSIQRIENGELIPRSHTLKTLASILGLSFDDFMKTMRGQELVPAHDRFVMSQSQRIILSAGFCLIILLLALAFLTQASDFPETTFELLVFVSVILLLLTTFLFFLWRNKAQG